MAINRLLNRSNLAPALIFAVGLALSTTNVFATQSVVPVRDLAGTPYASAGAGIYQTVLPPGTDFSFVGRYSTDIAGGNESGLGLKLKFDETKIVPGSISSVALMTKCMIAPPQYQPGGANTRIVYGWIDTAIRTPAGSVGWPYLADPPSSGCLNPNTPPNATGAVPLGPVSLLDFRGRVPASAAIGSTIDVIITADGNVSFASPTPGMADATFRIQVGMPTVAPASRVTDYNGDAQGDLVMQHPDGSIYSFLMNAYALVGQGFVVSAPTNWGWKLVATGDLNGDGRADMILQRPDNGAIWGFIMNGTSITSSGPIYTPTGTWPWRVVGTGDISGDGKADIILENTNDRSVWGFVMNGLTITHNGPILSAPGSGWFVAGVGDLNGDGIADLVSQNAADGSLYGYKLNGLSVLSSGWITAANPTWAVAALGDLNGDGKADIVLENTSTGNLYVYIMSDTSIVSSGPIGASTNFDWSVRVVTDLNNDNRGDIVMQHASGAIYAFLMNGTSVLSSNFIVSAPPANWGWRVLSPGE